MINKIRISDVGKDSDQYHEKPENVDFMWGEKIPMRDGIHLNATIYKPIGSDPTPAIFTLTPLFAATCISRCSLPFARLPARYTSVSSK